MWNVILSASYGQFQTDTTNAVEQTQRAQEAGFLDPASLQ
jgi:hypothetical protein